MFAIALVGLGKNSLRAIGILLIFSSTQLSVAMSSNVVSPEQFGAKANDNIDDTDAIQKALNHLANSGNRGEIRFPQGRYLINVRKSLRLPSNIVFNMHKDTILKAIPTHRKHYNLLAINNVENIKIVGGRIVGERNEHLGNGGEWGHGIALRGAKNITIENVVVKDFWGDGLYIGAGNNCATNENILVSNLRADNNRRQGISIITGKNVKVIDSVLTNTNGTAPQSGIDIEPHRPCCHLEDIVIKNVRTARNAGQGILINLQKLNNNDIPRQVDILVENHVDEASTINFKINNKWNSVSGLIRIIQPVWKRANAQALSIRNYLVGPRIVVREAKITDANQGNRSSSKYGSAISISRTKKDRGGTKMGNVHLYRLSVSHTLNRKVVYPISILENNQGGAEKISVHDPILLESQNGSSVYFRGSVQANIRDRHNQIRRIIED